MLLTNNSPDLYALTLCIIFRKNNLFLARLPGISANSKKIIHFIKSRLLLIFPEISGQFTTLVVAKQKYFITVVSAFACKEYIQSVLFL